MEQVEGLAQESLAVEEVSSLVLDEEHARVADVPLEALKPLNLQHSVPMLFSFDHSLSLFLPDVCISIDGPQAPRLDFPLLLHH